MSAHYYGINYGDNTTTSVVTTGTSDTSKDIQVVIKDGTGMHRADAYKAVDRIMRFIVAEDASSVFGG